MTTRFCTACKEERTVENSTQTDNQLVNILTCGHRFIEINLKETIKISEEIQLRKMGDTNEKYRKGDKPPNIDYARKFIQYGDIDYEAALILFDIQDRDYDFINQAAFLSAQAVEKYLKAFLFWNSPKHFPNLSGAEILKHFRKLSHDLEKILNECWQDNSDFKQFTMPVSTINKYSLLKYPDVEDQMVYSEDGLTISSQILKDVKLIGDFVKNLLIL